MIKVLEEVNTSGSIIQCPDCESVIFCDFDEWKKCSYVFKGKLVNNEYVTCPKCFNSVIRYEDRSWD